MVKSNRFSYNKKKYKINKKLLILKSIKSNINKLNKKRNLSKYIYYNYNKKDYLVFNYFKLKKVFNFL